MTTNNNEPCLVETEQGFSVSYNGKYLYSKRNPKRVISTLVANTDIGENCLVILASPVLGYGVPEILAKIPESSFLLAVEFDQTLFELAKKHITYKTNRFKLIQAKSVQSVIKEVQSLEKMNFKTVIFFEGSGGAKLNEDFYREAVLYAKQSITQNWINKLTLIKMGHTYAANFFKNLKRILKKNTPVKSITDLSISKPVLVVAAGPSLDFYRNFISRNREKLFILCVDAAISSLLPEIIPDGVIILESQFWIDSAFTGSFKFNIPLFADLTSSPRIMQAQTKAPVYLYFTEYTSANYLNRLKEENILPQTLQPMGSVGLTAASIALSIRKKPSVPIFFTGLDFSWQSKFTHSNESSQVKALRIMQTKINPLQNGERLFPKSLQKTTGTNKKTIYTTPVLQSYCDIFNHAFVNTTSHSDNVYRLLGLRQDPNAITESTAQEIINRIVTPPSCKTTETCISKQSLEAALNNIKTELDLLRDCFTGKTPLPDESVKNLLEKNDFLYLHFPDNTVNLKSEFLNRVRIELEYFIKFLSV
ncbi:MAG: hypothetical protein CR988_05330 [Treponema sp.]|nr:MAG: hypothetical protein CR988_05330 [Treponema sp.]